MNVYRALISLLTVLCLFFTDVPASQADTGSPTSGTETLAPIEITATRSPHNPKDIPNAVSVVDQEDIRRARATITLEESLHVLPGLFVQNPYNFTQDLRLSIRGFGTRSPFGVRGIKILVDDIPHTLPDGISQLDSVDPGGVERIELLRGPSASLYGNASGGVVSIFTDSGPDLDLEIEPRLLAGSFGLLKTRIRLGGRIPDGNYSVFGSRLEFNGYRQQSVTENLLFRTKVNLRGSTGAETQWTAHVFHSPQAEDPGGLTAVQAAVNPRQAQAANVLFDAGEEVQQEMFSVRWRKPFNARQELALVTHMVHRDFTNRLPFVSGGQATFDRWAPGAGLKYIDNSPLLDKSNRVIAGLDFFYQNDRRQRFDNNFGTRGNRTLDQREMVDSLGVYLRNEMLLSERWELTAGGRYDRIHFRVSDAFGADGDQSGAQTFSQGSGTLGILFRPAEEHRIYFNAATVFETPTTTELINNPSGTGGMNPGIQPQTSYSFELGVKGNSVLEYEAALFYIRTEDEITPYELAAFPGRTFFRNSGTTIRKGFESQVRWCFLDRWRATVSYSYSDFEFGDFPLAGQNFKYNRLPGIPVHRAAGEIRYQNPEGLYSRLQAEYVGSLYVNNDNTVKNESYTVTRLELGIQRTWGVFQGALFAGMNNLLDESYNANVRINAALGRYFEPAPPFNAFAGISLRWTP